MRKFNFIVTAFITGFIALSLSPARAADGVYDATVTIKDGAYHVPVHVENDTVTKIDWPDDRNTIINGAVLNGGNITSGTDIHAETIKIEITDPSYEAEDEDDSEQPDGGMQK